MNYEQVTQDLRTALENIGEEILDNKRRNGWKITTAEDWKNQHEVPGVLMLIVSEVAEALEAFRDDDPEHFAEELADVMIRTVGLTHTMGIDLAGSITAKMAKNLTRPVKHGRKKL